jgi:hypothetical protein
MEETMAKSKKQSDKEYYQEHREKLLTYQRKYRAEHLEKITAYRRKYYQEHMEIINAWRIRTRERNNETNRKNVQKIRIEVLQHYGGKCTCCGETELKFLTLDHINGGGNEHRRKIGIHSGSLFYRWVRSHNYPDYLQVLCHNCNQAKCFYGECPHKSNSKGSEE